MMHTMLSKDSVFQILVLTYLCGALSSTSLHIAFDDAQIGKFGMYFHGRDDAIILYSFYYSLCLTLLLQYCVLFYSV